MNVIIAAVVGGILLLWGGIVGLLRVIDLFERKHILFLGAYTTLVAGCVMGLVLYTNYERQKENRRELQNQMTEFSKRLSNLSEKLVGQLEEKADLTASEFEIRVKLQNEVKNHTDTQLALVAKNEEYADLKETLDGQLATQRKYQAEVDQKLDERFKQEETRYQNIQKLLNTHESSLQIAKKQLGALQDDLSKLNNETTALQKTQSSLLAKVSNNQQILERKNQDLATKIETLTRNQASFQQGLNAIKTQVDSLYTWRQK